MDINVTSLRDSSIQKMAKDADRGGEGHWTTVFLVNEINRDYKMEGILSQVPIMVLVGHQSDFSLMVM